MGGRGSGSGRPSAGSPDGVFPSDKTTTIEVGFRDRRSRGGGFSYDQEVLEATTDGSGNVTFEYARGGDYEKRKTNIKGTATFELKAGAVDGETFNIDWSKVNSVSGKTYSVKEQARAAGLRWDGNTKTWRRK